MSQPDWVPDRGDLIWLDFDPQAGHEQAGRRPAFVLSPASYNRLLSLALVCPITSREKGYLWEWPVPPGLRISGFILTDQIRSLDWKARRGTLADRLPDPEAAGIMEAARRLLD